MGRLWQPGHVTVPSARGSKLLVIGDRAASIKAPEMKERRGGRGRD